MSISITLSRAQKVDRIYFQYLEAFFSLLEKLFMWLMDKQSCSVVFPLLFYLLM